MRRAYGLLSLVLLALSAYAPLAVARDALRVCADPNNMPFSHKDETGLENKLAKIWLRSSAFRSNTWFPQRLGFLRNQR